MHVGLARSPERRTNACVDRVVAITRFQKSIVMQIVLARVEEDRVVVKQGRVDVGERHTFRMVLRPVSLMWLNDGDEADAANARAFAATEGYRVFCYATEADPLDRARRDVLAA